MNPPGSTVVRLELWPEPYAVAQLQQIPADIGFLRNSQTPVSLVMVPGDLTLMAPQSLIDALPDGQVETCSRGWRAVTIDARFPAHTVGVLAAVGRALAEVNVPVMAFSSHATDHFLVPEKDLGRALVALHNARLERFLPR